MHVLVTGGAGYVGSRVVAHLLLSGHSVRVLDKLIYGGEALLAFEGFSQFALVPGDVRDKEVVAAALDGVDAVVHLAAVVGEPACSLDTEAAWSINVEGSRTVIEAAASRRTPRVVFVSTCSNYGVSDPSSLATEESDLNPLSLYAKSKVEAELMLLAPNALPCATVLRLGTICGLGPRMRFDLLVSEMAKQACHGVPIEIYAPEAWRPFLHIRDAGRVIEHVVGSSPVAIDRAVFNVVGENYQKRGLAELVRRYFPGATIKIVDRAADPRDYRVDGGKIERGLGFKPAFSVEDAFRETATAVAANVFRDADWPGHSAIPLRAGAQS